MSPTPCCCVIPPLLPTRHKIFFSLCPVNPLISIRLSKTRRSRGGIPGITRAASTEMDLYAEITILASLIWNKFNLFLTRLWVRALDHTGAPYNIMESTSPAYSLLLEALDADTLNISLLRERKVLSAFEGPHSHVL